MIKPQPFEARNRGPLHDLFQQPPQVHKGWVPTQPERGSRPRPDERQHLSHSKLDALDQLGKVALRDARYPDEPNIPHIGQRGTSRKQQKHFAIDDHLREGPSGLIDSQKLPEEPIPKRRDPLHDHFKGMVIEEGSREKVYTDGDGGEARGMKMLVPKGDGEGSLALEGVPLPAPVLRDALPTENSRQVQDALLGRPLPENPLGRRDRLPKEDSSQYEAALHAVPVTPDAPQIRISHNPRNPIARRISQRDILPWENSKQVVNSLCGAPLPDNPNRRGSIQNPNILPWENSKQVGAVVSGWQHAEAKERTSKAAMQKLPGWANSKQVRQSILGVPLENPKEPPKIDDAELPGWARSKQVDAALHQDPTHPGLYKHKPQRIRSRASLPCEDSRQVIEVFQRMQTEKGPRRSVTQEDMDRPQLHVSRSEPTLGLHRRNMMMNGPAGRRSVIEMSDDESSSNSTSTGTHFVASQSGNMAPCAPHAQGAIPARRMSDSIQASATAAISGGFGRGYKFGYGGFLWNHPSRLRSSECAMLQNAHTDPCQPTYMRQTRAQIHADTRILCTT